MREIYLLRHEEVVKKYRNRYYGHLDVALSVRGKVRALNTAKKLNAVKFDAIYCSDLSRARFMLNGLKQKNEAILTKEIREMSWGVHEGLSHDDLKKLGFKYENFEQWLSLFDGENLDDFKNRVLKFFANLKNKNEKRILLISHSGVIRTILAHLNSTTIEEEFLKELPYGSITKLKID